MNRNDGQLVFIKDAGVFGLEIDYTLQVEDETFFQILDINTLERILKTQIEKENFESASIIKKHIDLKMSIDSESVFLDKSFSGFVSVGDLEAQIFNKQ